MEWEFNSYYTLIAATLVLLLGKFLVKKIRILRDFNIPEPVAGGLIAALVLFVLHQMYGVSFKFEKPLQDAFMLIFFASIGLSADFSRLKAGGLPLVIFTVVVGLYIVVQNAVGVGLATVLGLDPLIGLMTGSVTLTGGHGTAGAWGPTFEKEYGVMGATTLGMAAATFGLVFGGLIGGPVARRLINRQGRKPISAEEITNENTNDNNDDIFEKAHRQRLITADNAVETLAMFAACLAFAEIMDSYDKQYLIDLPKFVWCLFFGVILRNVLTGAFKVNMFDRAIDVFGNASLSLFLAMALLNLKLWELTGMAGPVAIILAVQVVVMILYATFVTYVVMGRDYDAAVLSAGHCGFGMGATPTAVANMQSITQTFGSSHKAFLIVPMVGAFFVDIVNVIILSGFLNFLK
ncbi:sodium/glutamate symporter [Neisseria sp. N95_16]|uniref:Sodium/glutamate symporter n=1 Tax=Neisseria brasiliensis TaxID=2666100 RepID=A0A5Q3RZB7_9NEIS|nr:MULTISPECIES: sodium/glutamate symporter [Neisseria]MRN38301.1 sodium/glutamate symporter [Neisseria brasiliensis]PJO08648.1 sodium/glutamate symporter [Neisseria sp. N95_16]PJO77433.1 sodium/glutamate symporter [Neisseria sp. N177_16]QGL25297.1 sodium/glutamate symporter [Neisseria brasiliensis]